MRENELTYNEVANYFGKERIADRYKFLYDRIREYIKVRDLEDKLEIQEGILQQTVMDYFVDIYRLKEFHKIDRVDIVKIISYTVYWIIRRRPIQAMQGNLDSKLIFANEGFVTTYIAHELLMSLSQVPMDVKEEKAFLQFLQHLNYHLKYRNLDKQTLELIIYAYQTGEKVCRGTVRL